MHHVLDRHGVVHSGTWWAVPLHVRGLLLALRRWRRGHPRRRGRARGCCKEGLARELWRVLWLLQLLLGLGSRGPEVRG